MSFCKSVKCAFVTDGGGGGGGGCGHWMIAPYMVRIVSTVVQISVEAPCGWGGAYSSELSVIPQVTSQVFS